MKSLFVCAGDPSGDMHASRLIAQLKQHEPDLSVWGVGGTKLEATGVELLYHLQTLSVIGITSVVKMLPMLARVRANLLDEIAQRKPDALLLVDYGGFNLSLASAVKKKHPQMPIIYFISPQVWGSRPWRIKRIAATVSKMLTIFPFEETLYRQHGVPAQFVGHPLTEHYADVEVEQEKQEFCKKYNLNTEAPIVAIFPGSRGAEVRNFMPMLLQAISWLHTLRPEVQFVLSQANPSIAEHIYEQINNSRKNGLIGSVLKLTNADDNRGLMAAGDILWTKSGTTTLEAAFMERPMLVFYRGDWVTFVLFLLFKRIKYVAWPNILAGRMLVPELFQLDCRAEKLVKYTCDWLDVPGARQVISDELRSIKAYLRKGDFAANAAQAVAQTLNWRVTDVEEPNCKT